MFTHTFSRAAVGVFLAALLLVPAAHADDWARDQQMTVDPVIASGIHDRASLQPEPATRPDDRAGARGAGALPQPAQVAAGHSFNLSRVGIGIGIGVALAALAGLGVLLAARRAPIHATSA